MSILGTCPECLHHTDGMCDLRPRICLNYDHFERRPMVTLTRDDFEKLYISRAAYDELNAKVAALTAALQEANEDAEGLYHWLEGAEIHNPFCKLISGGICTCGFHETMLTHRARCAKLEGGESVKDSPKEEAKG